MKTLIYLISLAMTISMVFTSIGCSPKVPSFVVVSLVVTPQEVILGQDVTVSVEIANIGDTQGIYDAALRIDGEVAGTESMTLLSSQRQLVHFTISHDTPGVHTVEVDGIFSSFTVEAPIEPAEFSVSNLSINPQEVEPTEPVTISLRIANNGGTKDSYQVILKVNDIKEHTRNITLGVGESEEVNFTVSEYITGVYSVNVNGLTGQFRVAFPPLEIRADATKVIGTLDSTLWANVGYEALYSVTVDEQLQPLWEQIRETQSIQYVRCHNLYSDGIPRGWQSDVQELLTADDIPIELADTNTTSSMYYGCRIYSENVFGEPVFNFWHLDHALDILLSAGVKPIMECDYMPDALADGQPVRNYGGGLVNTPDDYEKWRELVYQTVKHCAERYGTEEVRSWYWECWNEPDLENYFIDGVPSGVSITTEQMERFLMMYDYFADGAKAADPSVRVGGPAIADHPDWLTFFLDHCDSGTNYATGNQGAPLDFISWHTYGSLDDILERNRIRQDIIELFPQLSDLPQLLDEWGRRELESALYTSYEASFLCKLIDSVLDSGNNPLDLLLRWSKLLVPTFKTGYKPLFFMVEGQIIPYPIMNAYNMLAKMGNESLELTVSPNTSSIGGFASLTDNGIQILIYRFKENYESDGQPIDIDLIVEGLSDSSYNLSHYRIDSQHSNAATLWEDMGQPTDPSESQLTQLESDSQLQLFDEPSQISTQNGQATIRLSMPYNSISLFILSEEFVPMFTPGTHITRVLQYEAMYQSAEQKLAEDDIQGAREDLEELIRDCVPNGFSTSGPDPYCFWGQKALFALGKLEEELGNYEAADQIWKRLLSTTLNDTDRLILLQRRIQYLEDKIIKPPEFNSLIYELSIVRSRLEVYAEWRVWSDTTNE